MELPMSILLNRQDMYNSYGFRRPEKNAVTQKFHVALNSNFEKKD